MAQESIGKYISVLSKYLNYYINKRVKYYNINKTQVEMLMILYQEEGITQNRLGENLMLDKITVTKQLDGLINEGYIVKRSGKEDKRTRELYVTEKANNIEKELRQILKETTEILSRDFNEEENKIIRELLKRMSNNIYQEVSDIN